jgi:NAD(P)-dependent dehydrogenase (short-subunit alcohol dehydrogenase family)
MRGRVCLVTGATSGIGKVTARELAKLGATVVAVGRDEAKGKATVDEIKAVSHNDNVHLLLCDLSSQASVRALAHDFKSKFTELHVLVNNAGVILGERQITADGLEATFAINHLAYFLLTNLLLEILEVSRAARIVSVASVMHERGTLEFDDILFERRPYSPISVYSASKLANVVWNAELARRIEGKGVTANVLHPGIISSNFGASGGGLVRFVVKMIKPFMKTPENGARTTLYVASSPEVDGKTGCYFVDSKPATPSAAARAADAGRRLWEISEQLTAKSAATVTAG